MANKARHAFGNLEDVDAAISNGVINSRDVLFVKDANGKPYVGWVDKDGNKVIVEDEESVIVIDGESLPEVGETGKIYICGEEGYFWDGSKFVSLSKPTDVTALESQVAELGTEVEQKVDAKTVQTMIEAYSDSLVEVIEF